MIKLTKRNAQILLTLSIILVFFAFQEPQLKQAVADVEGRACTTDKECPCFGGIEGTDIKSFGIGTASCDKSTLTCDTTYCIDVEPVGQFFKTKPLEFIKGNILFTLGIIGVLLVLIFWPKQ